MQKYKLANVLLESDVRSITVPTLYCRGTAASFENSAEGGYELRGPGEFDFTTYFNACSSKKWKLYTVVDTIHIHLEVRGAASTLMLTHADTFSTETEYIEDCEVKVPQSDDWQVFEFAFPDLPDELLAFKLNTTGRTYIRNAYYFSEIDEGSIRDVELALATTTFKKEDFIIPNIDLLKESILEGNEPVAKHFSLLVVDNGRTLDVKALSDERIHIFPNKNVGGSGGFARGMIEAMRAEPRATHVLLMDDDVAVSPESIIRTFNILSLVRDEYRDAFVSGAMLNYDVPDEQWEDLGYLDPGGYFFPMKAPLRMSQLRDITLNEGYVPNKRNMYAAWWYCCIPVTTIEQQGLPLTLFVRSDDVEYGCRCHPKFITMNGICIWHVSFHTRYNAAVERYQTTRNTLISQAVTGIAPDVDFLVQFKNGIQIELKKFNYRDAELALDGFEDYMKGPEFIMEDRGEQLFKEKGRDAEKLKSFDELDQELDEFEVNRSEVYDDEPRSMTERVFDFVTFNGQRTPFSYRNSSDETVIIPAEGWRYPAGKIRGAKKLLAIDAYNKKGIVRTRDKDRFNEVWGRYKKDMKEYKQCKNELISRYAAARDKLTSVEFWKEYLEIE